MAAIEKIVNASRSRVGRLEQDETGTDRSQRRLPHGRTRLAAHAERTVAEHSLLVERIASELEPKLGRDFRLAALIHDAPEYVIGDLISPFKAALSLDYRAFEAKLLAAIHVRFGLPAELPDNVVKSIKRADRIAAYYEATGLAGFSQAEARKFFGQPRGLSAPLVQRQPRSSDLPALPGNRVFPRNRHPDAV